MKEILKPKSKALTEKDCYEELARIIKIYCYQWFLSSKTVVFFIDILSG